MENTTQNLDDKGITIIISISPDDDNLQRFDYLVNLEIPDGYHVDVCSVSGSCLAQNYNIALQNCSTKYKIYLDQHTKIEDMSIISRIIDCFAMSERIAVIGVAGIEAPPPDGNYWHSKSRVGRSVVSGHDTVWGGDMQSPFKKVLAVDGYFFATQHDAAWGEILYDDPARSILAMCLEQRKAGYYPVVLQQEKPVVSIDSLPEMTSDKSLADVVGEGFKIAMNSQESKRFIEKYELCWNEINECTEPNRKLLAAEPLISVIMPAYNGANFIGAAIESILLQTYKNWELVIVEDHSSDKTGKILKEYAARDKRIRLFFNRKNRGISASTNRAIAEAKGKYIALLDDDDLSMPERLEVQAAYLETHPEIDILGGRTINICERGSLDNWWYIPPRSGLIHANLLFNMGGFGNGTAMMRRDFIVDNNLCYKDYCYGMQDMKFYMDAAPIGRIDALPTVFLLSRAHSHQETLRQGYGQESTPRAKAFARFQCESLKANGIVLGSLSMAMLNRLHPEMKTVTSYVRDVAELKSFMAVCNEIYRQGQENGLWFIEEVRKLLLGMLVEQASHLGLERLPDATINDLPENLAANKKN